MKIAYSLLASVLMLTALAGAQSPPQNVIPNTVFVGADGKFESAPDTALIQFNISAQADTARIEGDKLIISSDPDSKTCLYLRVYRVKREGKKSDVTVPSGYTTCVSVDRFEKKSADSPTLQFIPQH